jgi:dTMP kinase
MFLVLDGLDGSGKSTQLDMLALWLRESGHPVVVCRDPGSTPLGDEIRQLILQKSEIDIAPGSEMLLFLAARCQLVRKVIRPALDAGKIVLCDRFQISTLVYQGHAGEVPLDDIRALGEFATGGLKPSHTFVLDVPADVALARLARGLDRMESRGLGYFERVREGFLAEARRDPGGCTVVDALQSTEIVAEEIRRQVERQLRVEDTRAGRSG